MKTNNTRVVALVKIVGMILSAAGMLLSCFVVSAQTTWTKRSVNSGASTVASSSMIGVLVVGQPVTGDVSSKNTNGWLGMLPISLKAEPTSVNEEGETYANSQIASAFPNPALDVVTLRMRTPVNVQQLTLADAFGRELSVSFTSTAPDVITLDVSALASGSYTVNITHNDVRSCIRIVILK